MSIEYIWYLMYIIKDITWDSFAKSFTLFYNISLTTESTRLIRFHKIHRVVSFICEIETAWSLSQALCQWLGCDTLSDSAWPDHISPGNNVTQCHTLCHEAPTTRLHLITIWSRAVLLNWVLCLIKYTTSEKNNYEMCTLILKVYTGEYCGNVVD